jgi:hypothetical protein
MAALLELERCHFRVRFRRMSWITALTCVVIPLLIVLVARRALIQQRQRAMLRAQHPNEPWLWRRDWASRTAADVSSAKSALLWLFAAAWNLIAWPVFFVVRGRTMPDPEFVVFALIPAAGVILLIVAAYQTLRRRKYGLSLCRFDALPLSLGHTLHGEVETSVDSVPQNGFQLRLTCLRHIVRSSGKTTTVEERILWQEEQRIGVGAAMPSPNGVRVPFRFPLPLGAEVADETTRHDRVIWRLEATAEVPGIDYRAVFELPVFARAESQRSETFATAFEAPWTPPPTIAFGMAREGGETIAIRPSSSVFDWVFYIVFIVLWFGALYLTWRMGAPIVVVALFALIGFGVLYFALDALGGRSVLTVNRTQLVSRRTFFGTRILPAAEVTSIEPRLANTSGRHATYDLQVHTRDGRSVTIARHLRARRDAEQVAARILRGLGKA